MNRWPTGADPRSESWSADEALEELYAAHWRSLVRTAVLLVGDTETAEDVVQDAFVAMHRHWRKLREPSKALGYLRRSVVNGARDALRRRGVAGRYITRETAEEGRWVSPAADEQALAHGRHQAVLAALHQLPRRQREVVVLRYYLDQPEAATADQLGISRGAAKAHASRGLARLRSLLPELREDEDGGAGDE